MPWDIPKRKNGITRRAWRIQVHVLQAPNLEQVQAYVANQSPIKEAVHAPLWPMEESLTVLGQQCPPSWDKVVRISHKDAGVVTSWGRRMVEQWAQQCQVDHPNAQVLFTAFSCTALHSSPKDEASACWMTRPGQDPSVVGAVLDEEGLRALGLMRSHLNDALQPSSLGLKYARKALIHSPEMLAFHLEGTQAWLRSHILEEELGSYEGTPVSRRPRM